VSALGDGLGAGAGAGAAGPERQNLPECRVVGVDTGWTGTCATANSVLTAGAVGERMSLPLVDVRVSNTEYQPAKTASGRRRQRSRLSIDLSVDNRTRRTVPLRDLATIFLRVGDSRVPADVRAGRLAGALDRSERLEPGARAEGRLRFELAGRQTRTFRRDGGTLGVQPAGSRDKGLRRIGIVPLPAGRS
jgi:hypothetical protein